jgi:hypothetical protein
MLKQDYIERMIAQIAQAVGRILGLAQSGRMEEAQREIEAAWSGLIGLRRSDVERLDEATLRSLLGAKRGVAADLLEAEASVREARGESAGAAKLRGLAASLRPSSGT